MDQDRILPLILYSVVLSFWAYTLRLILARHPALLRGYADPLSHPWHAWVAEVRSRPDAQGLL